jgi:oligopeptide/dipeptide ABC transporter ATP-binding protein
MPLLEVAHLVKTFTRGGGLFRTGTTVAAVDDVSFAIEEGETFGLVGESGSGKTTTGRCILRLIEPTSGAVRFRGENVLAFSRSRMRAARRDLQIVFQDPYASLNPRMRVRDIVEEPLIIHRLGDRPERRRRVEELFGLVGLDPSQLPRYRHQFSGGPRQRIGLARALALNPSFVILDEPVSALDVTIQAEILDLLREMKRAVNLAMLLITHDLGVIAETADRVAVMYAGRIVETGPVRDVLRHPQHPYTRGLLASMPGRHQRGRLKAIEGAVPLLGQLPPGCAFNPRCPERFEPCTSAPPPDYAAGPDQTAKCYLHAPR